MGLRSGAAYLEGLRDGRSLYINGERVDDVTAHPAFQGVLTTLAGLYDAQLDPEFAEVLTVWDDATGEAHSTTLLEARSHEDVLARLRCDRLRTELTYGMMGRLPDFMNAYLLDVRSSLEHVGKHEEAARMGPTSRGCARRTSRSPTRWWTRRATARRRTPRRRRCGSWSVARTAS